MGGRGRVHILHADIDRLSFDEAVRAVVALVECGEGGLVVTPNVDHLMLLRTDAEFREVYRYAKLVLADGMPLLWASRLLGRALPERVAGSDLLPRLCREAEKRSWRVFVLGGHPGRLDETVAAVRRRFPDLVLCGAYSPPFGFERDAALEAETMRAVLRAKPQILFVGLGSPKQEKLAWRHRKALGGIVTLGVGMGIDLLAGRVRRAPPWMQKIGLEWLYRLAREPGRLWRRYLLRDAVFPWLVLLQLFRPRRDQD